MCDGLKGLPEAIEATWPLAVIQTCVPPPASATPSGWRHEPTGTRWPAICGRCTPRPAGRPLPSASPTSTSSGREVPRGHQAVGERLAAWPLGGRSPRVATT
ncbi:hypothetical protein [Egibacter rhizosphaerae]|uniref:hypothetical protein n=1 Tax=Egibacter rhizosphaerae TaxID=1670831 RepID=UPI003B836C64